MQIQKPSISDSGSFHLTQGFGAYTFDKDTTWKTDYQVPPRKEIHIDRAWNCRYNPRSGRTCEGLKIRATFRDKVRLSCSLYSYDHLGGRSIAAGQRQETTPDSPAFQPQSCHTTDYSLGELLGTWGLYSSSSTDADPQYKNLAPNTVQSQNFWRLK